MRNIVLALCALMIPLVARAQSPAPAPNPVLQASAKLAAVSMTAPSYNDVLAVETAAQKRKSTGKLLMIIGGAAVVSGAIIGDGGGAALIVAGILTGGYGFWLFQEK